jgi:MFS transporter, SP family, major inositol transporter
MEATEHLSESRAARNVVLTAGIAGLGGLLFGYDTGVIAGALLFIKPDFHLDSFEAGLVVSAVPIGAVFGAAMAGPLSDGKGRRGTILLSAIIFAIGALGSAAAPGTACS